MRRALRALRWPVAGMAAGLAWGTVARVWMRYISTDPEFTWSGTLAILALTSLAGACLASVEGLRRNGNRGWRGLVAVPAVVMFASPGAVMLPTAVLGGLALSGRGGRRVRYPAALVALAAPALFGSTLSELPHSTVLSLAWYALLCLGLALAWRSVFLPRLGTAAAAHSADPQPSTATSGGTVSLHPVTRAGQPIPPPGG